MLTFLQIEQMDAAVHKMANAFQRVVLVTHGTPAAIAVSNASLEFRLAREAYHAAKGGAPGWDANGSEAGEVAQ